MIIDISLTSFGYKYALINLSWDNYDLRSLINFTLLDNHSNKIGAAKI